MKKYYNVISVFFLSFLFIPFHFSLAADIGNEACTQEIQFAVSPLGECKAFPTSCDIPTDWKKIDSCDLIQNKNTGSDITQVAERKRQDMARWAEQKNAQQKKETNSSTSSTITSTIGRGALTKSGAEYQHRMQASLKGTENSKTFVTPNYSTSNYSLLKQLNPQKQGGYNNTTKKSITSTPVATQAPSQTATEMDRSGPLKSFNKSNGEKPFSEPSIGSASSIWQDPYKKQQMEYKNHLSELRKQAVDTKMNSNKHPAFRGDMSIRRQFGDYANLASQKKTTTSTDSSQ